MKKQFSEEQIISILKEAESVSPIKDILRKYNISDTTFYKWREKCGGMEYEGLGCSPSYSIGRNKHSAGEAFG